MRTKLAGHVSLSQLAIRLKTYPSLLHSLCKACGVKVVVASRTRFVREADVADLKSWVKIWKRRPKLSRPGKISARGRMRNKKDNA